jgi:hypothetical protein
MLPDFANQYDSDHTRELREQMLNSSMTLRQFLEFLLAVAAHGDDDKVMGVKAVREVGQTLPKESVFNTSLLGNKLLYEIVNHTIPKEMKIRQAFPETTDLEAEISALRIKLGIRERNNMEFGEHVDKLSQEIMSKTNQIEDESLMRERIQSELDESRCVNDIFRRTIHELTR